MTRNIAETLANDIKRYIAAERLDVGVRLTERSLAVRFHVSRSPVREALGQLASQGIITEHEDGGYVVSEQGAALEDNPVPDQLEASELDAVYFAIAEHRLGGLLPERVTENDLTRRYGVTRAQLSGILRRVSQEGWIERLPGHGWRFLPVLTSAETYEQGYRFRILIESAGILEPTFHLNQPLLRRCEDQQRALLDRIADVSAADLFNANTFLHESIAECSGNVFILESLKRLNSLRRLMEYRKSVDREAAARRCREHLTLINLLLTGEYEAAADFMTAHLRDAAREKSTANS